LLARLLFLLTVTAALALALTVLFTPWFDADAASAEGWPRVLALFARDTTVRRTALASSAGLLATAFVFFRAKKPAKPN
jgi:hypothetical protein